jgi:hypothetical protein
MMSAAGPPPVTYRIVIQEADTGAHLETYRYVSSIRLSFNMLS